MSHRYYAWRGNLIREIGIEEHGTLRAGGVLEGAGRLAAGDLLRALTLPARGWEVSAEGDCVVSLGSKRDARGWQEEPKVLLMAVQSLRGRRGRVLLLPACRRVL